MVTPTLDSNRVSVVLLGKTQSGKSTFMEAVQKYADQNYNVAGQLIGNGYVSHTEEVRFVDVHTSLPVYQVYDELLPTVIHPAEIEENDPVDYADRINRRKGLQLQLRDQGLEAVSFDLVDTPGLSDTPRPTNTLGLSNTRELSVTREPSDVLRRELGHIISVSNALASRSVSLAIVTIQNGTISQETMGAIRSYFDAFPDFRGVVAFLHTSVRCESLHTANISFLAELNKRTTTLREIINQTNFPEFYIDCDILNNNPYPIRDCIAHNTIWKILQLAAFNEPVAVPSSIMNKTHSMKVIDALLICKYRDILSAMDMAIRVKWVKIEQTLFKMFKLEADIIQTNARMATLLEFTESRRTTDLWLIHEERYDQDRDREVLSATEPLTMEFSSEIYVIDQVKTLVNNIDIINTEGGEGKKYWKATFQKGLFRSGVLHVKIYIEKRKRYAKEIEQADSEYQRLKQENGIFQQDLELLMQSFKITSKEIHRLRRERLSYHHFLVWLAKDSLPKETFQYLVEKGAYLGAVSKAHAVIKDIYFNTIHLVNPALVDGTDEELVNPLEAASWFESQNEIERLDGFRKRKEVEKIDTLSTREE